MAERSLREKLDAALLVLAVTLGSLPVALFASAALARFLPMSADARYAIAFALAIPIWLAAMSATLLARSGARALLACLAASLVLGALVFGIG